MTSTHEIREIDMGKPMQRFARGMALHRPRRRLPRWKTPRHQRIRYAARRLRRLAGRPAGARRLLQTYGWRSFPGDRQGRFRGVPVPRLALAGFDRPLRRRCRTPNARPRLARTRNWPAGEVNGQLLVWHDPEGSAPPAELFPPTIDGYDEGLWSPWSWNSIHIEGSHCREIVDNNVDMAHFFYIHRAYPTYFKNVIEGQAARQFMESKARPDTTAELRKALGGNKSPLGGHVLRPRLHDQLAAQRRRARLHPRGGADQLPLPRQSELVRAAVGRRRAEDQGLPEDKADEAGRHDEQERSVRASSTTWRCGSTRPRIDNPLLTEEDGAVYQHRRWYEQFYVDVADVTADMADRFELEVDTTHANGIWQREVAENLSAVAPG